MPVTKYPHLRSSPVEAACPEPQMVVGLWHNVGYVLHGDRLTVALGGALEDEIDRDRPRFTITLCPKKIQAWRINQCPTSPAASADHPSPASAPPSVSSASSADTPCHPLVERMLGIRLPPNTQVFLFEG